MLFKWDPFTVFGSSFTLTVNLVDIIFIRFKLGGGASNKAELSFQIQCLVALTGGSFHSDRRDCHSPINLLVRSTFFLTNAQITVFLTNFLFQFLYNSKLSVLTQHYNYHH